MTTNFKLSVTAYKITKFPTGEIQVKLNTPFDKIAGKHVIIQGSILSSDHIMELLQLVEAVKLACYDSVIHLVMPYCAYSRQDRICNPRRII